MTKPHIPATRKEVGWQPRLLRLQVPDLLVSSPFAGRFPVYPDWDSPDDLANEERVRRRLQEIDWAFGADDTGFGSHAIHPYPAKFIPQIPGHLITALSLPGDVVMDAFGGSGTTAFEAVRLRRGAISIDANPIGCLIARVKTCRVDKAVVTELNSIIGSLAAALTEGVPNVAALLEKYHEYVPDIPNIEKWFSDVSCAELALIRFSIKRLTNETAQDIASLALSKAVTRVSFQDSETRYVSRPKATSFGQAISEFVTGVGAIVGDVAQAPSEIQFGTSEVVQADARTLDCRRFPDGSVDLIVTSPPYGNALDYHLYNRFRLFWIGHDPRELAKLEVGSHLRHQHEGNGFEAYAEDLGAVIEHMSRLLRCGRYAAIVIGDSIYAGQQHDGGALVTGLGVAAGLHPVEALCRPIHRTKRSVTHAGRRATQERIVVLRKADRPTQVRLWPTNYRLWPYEEALRHKESEVLSATPVAPSDIGDLLVVNVDLPHRERLKRAVFSHAVQVEGEAPVPTWHSLLENGYAAPKGQRKEPNYATHGIHPYKGKFYAQLAKSLLNSVGAEPGAVVLDPFCGSGTALLESYLGGLVAVGCDLNPMAVRIAKAKLGVLDVDPALVSSVIETLFEKLASTPAVLPDERDQFTPDSEDEINRWFPPPVVLKLNWLLRSVRTVSAGTVQLYLEVLLSSIVREISQQSPDDLRIRRRKEPLQDADVLSLFRSQLTRQYERLIHYWRIRGSSPVRFRPATVVEGDSRKAATFASVGLGPSCVDFVLTSPPYATALPYIDTDRLSLLVLDGLNSQKRRPLDFQLTGSREIATKERAELERRLRVDASSFGLPAELTSWIGHLQDDLSATEAGFRRLNTPSLLLRYFVDMQQVLKNVSTVLKPNGSAVVVMGDNSISVGARPTLIPTSRFVQILAESCGMELREAIPITVTTENRVHIKHAIKKNRVLVLGKQ